MESIWEKTCMGPARPPLYGKAQADVAVIGGGMTGILTALELQERGLHTKAVLITGEEFIILSALQPETISRRFNGGWETEKERGESENE